jgi:hypothetical protein
MKCILFSMLTMALGASHGPGDSSCLKGDSSCPKEQLALVQRHVIALHRHSTEAGDDGNDDRKGVSLFTKATCPQECQELKQSGEATFDGCMKNGGNQQACLKLASDHVKSENPDKQDQIDECLKQCEAGDAENADDDENEVNELEGYEEADAVEGNEVENTAGVNMVATASVSGNGKGGKGKGDSRRRQPIPSNTPSPTAPPTASPTAPPTPLPHGCAPWCAADTRWWQSKCTFSVCHACDDCASGNACQMWCFHDPADWATKCTWGNKCGDCEPCQREE